MYEPVLVRSQPTKSKGKHNNFTTKACTGQAGSGKIVLKELIPIEKDAKAHEKELFQQMFKAKEGNKTVQVV